MSEPIEGRWANAIDHALRQRGMSLGILATRIQKSRSLLYRWMKTGDPDPRQLKSIARETGISAARQAELLGWIEPTVVTHSAEMWQAIEEFRQASSVALEAISGSAAAIVTGVAERRCPDWKLMVFARPMGQRWRIERYNTHIGFIPTAAPRLEPAQAQEQLYEELRDVLEATEATWKRPASQFLKELVAPDRGDTMLDLIVPELLGPRGPSAWPWRLQVGAILVTGIGFSGRQDVASLVAQGLGWGLRTVSQVARQRFRLSWTRDANPEEWVQAQIDIAAEVCANPGAFGPFQAWAGPTTEAMIDARKWLPEASRVTPLIVAIEVSESSRRWMAVESGTRMENLETAQKEVARQLNDRPPDSSMRVPIEVEQGPGPQRDRNFDRYVETAIRVMEWLHERHGGPGPEEARGTVGTAWRTIRTQQRLGSSA